MTFQVGQKVRVSEEFTDPHGPKEIAGFPIKDRKIFVGAVGNVLTTTDGPSPWVRFRFASWPYESEANIPTQYLIPVDDVQATEVLPDRLIREEEVEAILWALKYVLTRTSMDESNRPPLRAVIERLSK